MAQGNGVKSSALHSVAPKRVAIVALGPSSLHYIQTCDRVGDVREMFDEVWTVNTYASIIKSDLLFHMDDIRVQELRASAGNARVEKMLRALKAYPNPIVTSVPHPEYPQTVAFPIHEVVEKFGSLYFNNTVAYMFAYAAYIGVSEIHAYGVDFTWPNLHEAEAGRACCEYWLGLCKAFGVSIKISMESTLMDAREGVNGVVPFYGYDAFVAGIGEVEPGKLGLVLSPKPLPSAAEIEKRYFHDRPSQVDVVDMAKAKVEAKGGKVPSPPLPPSPTGGLSLPP